VLLINFKQYCLPQKLKWLKQDVYRQIQPKFSSIALKLLLDPDNSLTRSRLLRKNVKPYSKLPLQFKHI